MDERGTGPVPAINQSLADRVEYIHSEARGFRDAQAGINASFDKRVSKLEFLDEQKDARLNGGAATFAKLEAQIEKVNSKIDVPWYKTLPMIVPAILLVFSWVYQFAKMPDADKFEELRNEVQSLKLEQAKLNLIIEKRLDPPRSAP